MRPLFLLLILALLYPTSGKAAAVQVYLADGGIIAAQKVWQSKDTIHVLVNRDTLLEFAPREINRERTFARKKRPAKHKQ